MAAEIPVLVIETKNPKEFSDKEAKTKLDEASKMFLMTPDLRSQLMLKRTDKGPEGLDMILNKMDCVKQKIEAFVKPEDAQHQRAFGLLSAEERGICQAKQVSLSPADYMAVLDHVLDAHFKYELLVVAVDFKENKNETFKALCATPEALRDLVSGKSSKQASDAIYQYQRDLEGIVRFKDGKVIDMPEASRLAAMALNDPKALKKAFKQIEAADAKKADSVLDYSK